MRLRFNYYLAGQQAVKQVFPRVQFSALQFLNSPTLIIKFNLCQEGHKFYWWSTGKTHLSSFRPPSGGGFERFDNVRQVASGRVPRIDEGKLTITRLATHITGDHSPLAIPFALGDVGRFAERTFLVGHLFLLSSAVAQSVERLAVNEKRVGSTPIGGLGQHADQFDLIDMNTTPKRIRPFGIQNVGDCPNLAYGARPVSTRRLTSRNGQPKPGEGSKIQALAGSPVRQFDKIHFCTLLCQYPDQFKLPVGPIAIAWLTDVKIKQATSIFTILAHDHGIDWRAKLCFEPLAEFHQIHRSLLSAGWRSGGPTFTLPFITFQQLYDCQIVDCPDKHPATVAFVVQTRELVPALMGQAAPDGLSIVWAHRQILTATLGATELDFGLCDSHRGISLKSRFRPFYFVTSTGLLDKIELIVNPYIADKATSKLNLYLLFWVTLRVLVGDCYRGVFVFFHRSLSSGARPGLVGYFVELLNFDFGVWVSRLQPIKKPQPDLAVFIAHNNNINSPIFHLFGRSDKVADVVSSSFHRSSSGGPKAGGLGGRDFDQVSKRTDNDACVVNVGDQCVQLVSQKYGGTFIGSIVLHDSHWTRLAMLGFVGCKSDGDKRFLFHRVFSFLSQEDPRFPLRFIHLSTSKNGSRWPERKQSLRCKIATRSQLFSSWDFERGCSLRFSVMLKNSTANAPLSYAPNIDISGHQRKEKMNYFVRQDNDLPDRPIGELLDPTQPTEPQRLTPPTDRQQAGTSGNRPNNIELSRL